MRYLILVAVLLAPAMAEAQYYVPGQAWGVNPWQQQAAAQARQQAWLHNHAMWQARIAQHRAQNPQFWAMQDLRMQMQDDMDRRMRQDQINRTMNPRGWWHGH